MSVPMFAAARWAPPLLTRLGPKRLAVAPWTRRSSR